MPEENINVEEINETETKKKLDIDGAVGAGALVGAGVVLGKAASWAYRKVKPKIQNFASKVAGAGAENVSDGEESGPDVVSDGDQAD